MDQRGEWFYDDWSILCLLYTLFLSLLHLHLRSSGIRSWRLGTPILGWSLATNPLVWTLNQLPPLYTVTPSPFADWKGFAHLSQVVPLRLFVVQTGKWAWEPPKQQYLAAVHRLRWQRKRKQMSRVKRKGGQFRQQSSIPAALGPFPARSGSGLHYAADSWIPWCIYSKPPSLGRGAWGRKDTCICMAESSAVHLKLSQRC